MEILSRGLGDLLRHVLAGGVLLFWLGFLQAGSESSECDVRALALASPTVAVLISVALGALIYAVHRGLLYWALNCVFALLQGRGGKGFLKICRWMRDVDDARWKRTNKDHADYFAQRGLSRWGDLVHFGYCASWAMFAAVLAAEAYSVETNQMRGAVRWLVPAIVLSAAGISNWRLINRDAWYASRAE